jgi:hypothetical protein
MMQLDVQSAGGDVRRRVGVGGGSGRRHAAQEGQVRARSAAGTYTYHLNSFLYYTTYVPKYQGQCILIKS